MIRYVMMLMTCVFVSLCGAVDTVEQIDTEIQSLESQLQSARKEALNDEMEAQPNRSWHWHAFSEDIQAEEGAAQRVEEIKKKIQLLREKKEQLQHRGNQ